MEKNVIVVDEQGNEYEATYPKRAKGLVKKGRARFVDENKICLACPPNEYLEDKEMSENTNVNAQETVAVEEKSEISLDYIFDEIKAIREQTEYLNEALKMLHCVESEGPGDIGAQAKANGIVSVVKCRETTNQQLLKFYEKVCDDLLQQEKLQRTEKIELVKGIWMSYLEKADDILFEDDKLDAVNYVRSQLDLLCMDILNDKI